MAEDPNFKRNKEFKRDSFNVVIGVIAQTALVILPIYLVLGQVLPMSITIVITIVSLLILKRTWWDKLSN